MQFVPNPDDGLADAPQDTFIWNRLKHSAVVKMPGVNVNVCRLDIANFNGEVSYRISKDLLTNLANIVTTSGAAAVKIGDCAFLPYNAALLEAGADPAIADSDGLLPCDSADWEA